MGFLDWFKSRPQPKGHEQKSSLSSILGGLTTSSAGIVVNSETAFQASVVLGCVSVISNGISQVPFRLYRKKGKSTLPATDTMMYRLMEDGPNPYMSQFEFRETIAMHLALTGNAYIWKNKVRGEVRELFPIMPGYVQSYVDPDGDGWDRIYHVELNEKTYVTLPSEDIWHIRWRGFNCIDGLSPLAAARDAIGISLATDKYLASSLKEGIRPSGILSVKSNMTSEQQKEFRKSFEAQYSGTENANKTMILSGDIGYSAMSHTNEDAQLIENREFQVSEICRYFGVMPIMVYHYSNTSTYSSSEQLFLQHKVHTLDPWYRRIETSANKHLLTPKQRHEEGLYFKFIDDGLLRGDSETRTNVLREKVFMGMLTPNEAREIDDMNPLPDGDTLMMQSAMSTLKNIVEGNNLKNNEATASEQAPVSEEAVSEDQENVQENEE